MKNGSTYHNFKVRENHLIDKIDKNRAVSTKTKTNQLFISNAVNGVILRKKQVIMKAGIYWYIKA